VDLTQERKGYATEAALNAVRLDYIERACGLPLSVFFNTTVFDGNFDEIPGVVEFFVRHAADVRVASFQLQADTGRGTVRARATPIGIDTVAAQIRAGACADIAFDTPVAGHAACNRYALTLVADGRVHDLYNEQRALAAMLSATAGVQFDRQSRGRALAALAGALLRRPAATASLVPWAARKAWAMRRDLWASRGRAHKLSFFIHNFMDACHLDRERIGACVFMVATADGPISMCLHNAKRDAFLLEPVELGPEAGAARWWDPLTGALSAAKPEVVAPALTGKTARGRRRIELRRGGRTGRT